MKCRYEIRSLATKSDWTELCAAFSDEGTLLVRLLETFASMGACLSVTEDVYIDRDFSAVYAYFYASLYRPSAKYCQRVHFFDIGYSNREGSSLASLAGWLAAHRRNYLGFIVLRPLRHAPVSHAVISSKHFCGSDQRILVHSAFKAHVLGQELEVVGTPIAEQDMRTGACAQAAIWCAGRHLWSRYSAPWFSMIDITEAALSPADSSVMQSLPAGSEYITADGMVRALRAMGEKPKVYGKNPATSEWDQSPSAIILRYIESGIPVILGLTKEGETGHSAVAIGAKSAADMPATWRSSDPLNVAAKITHFIINDDQNGAYRNLPVTTEDVAPGDRYPFVLESHLDFLLIPLPNKVFITGEAAESLAWDKVSKMARDRLRRVEATLGREKASRWNVDPGFYEAVDTGLVARTYLTLGWKYRQRALSNNYPKELTDELNLIQLPRYVWVTEFSLTADVAGHDPCQHKVRGHVLVDATGSRFWDSTIVLHVPGIIVIERFDVASGGRPETVLRVLEQDSPYFPKVRGWSDYEACSIAANVSSLSPSPEL